MHILILEDEIPAKKKLIGYLVDYFGDALTIQSARTVKEGMRLLKECADFDIILSDIKLLDGDVFKVFQQVETNTPIIFCTAYDEHLLQAFQANGIAYILKPYHQKDLEAALKKFDALFEPKSFKKELFHQLREVLDAKEENYKRRLAIKKVDGIKLLETSRIVLIQASGDFCKIIDDEARLHSISKSIGQLHKELNPKVFFKINRSQIVGIDYIKRISPYSKNRLALSISGVKDHVITSTATTKAFRVWLEQ